ncbi:MAG: twin-arginine translocase TatA/TatE family subunit [Chloroflexi bacterium]|nr:twin-arginine translocase TatA/TatE family subunit [Chloroflexota bacterium]
MDFLGLGTGELVVVLIVALIFVGPERMVGVARSLGQWTRRIGQAGKEFTSQLEKEVEFDKTAKELKVAAGKGGETLSGLSQRLNQAGREVNRQINEELSLEDRPTAAAASLAAPDRAGPGSPLAPENAEPVAESRASEGSVGDRAGTGLKQP